MTVAFYAGTFDPPTNGHVWVIRRALEMFERVIVGVGGEPYEAELEIAAAGASGAT